MRRNDGGTTLGKFFKIYVIFFLPCVNHAKNISSLYSFRGEACLDFVWVRGPLLPQTHDAFNYKAVKQNVEVTSNFIFT